MDRSARVPASLWPLAVAPTIWALHFLLSYVTAALVCARGAGASPPLVALRLLLSAYTLLALLALAQYGRRCARQPAAAPSARFLDRLGLWLAALSAVAVIYAGMPALFFTGCR